MSISPFPPEPVRHPVMFQNWESLTFLHWRYDPAVIARFLPRGLEVDTFDGAAWVGLTPFLLTGLRPPYTPALPWLSRFPETNVRTYVRSLHDGYPGIWFFSLDAARLAAVAGARATYGLPYMWSRMTVVRDRDGGIRYGAHRRWPDRHAWYDIAVAPGPLFRAEDLGQLDHFLTARYRLYTTLASRLACAQVDHPPWPLAPARLESMDQTILEAAGLPQAVGAPILHHSPGVSVRIGRPKLSP